MISDGRSLQHWKMKNMDTKTVLESLRKLMRTILDPPLEYDRNCAFAATRALLADLEDYLGEKGISDAQISEGLSKLKYHVRVIAGFENRGNYLEIQHYKFAVDIVNDFLNHDDLRAISTQEINTKPLLSPWEKGRLKE